MGAGAFDAFYHGELQSLWAQVALPAVFLVYLLARGRTTAEGSGDPQARFVWLYALVFATLTIVDPIATGPLGRWLGLPEAAQTVVMLVFVLLGDFRVFFLVVALALAPRRREGVGAWSVRLTLLVPVFAYAVDSGLRLAWRGLPAQVLWLVYEAAFVALALTLRGRVLPRIGADLDARRRGFLRAVLAYVAAYYALWASADVLILSGVDAGWGLRILPNQLYYAAYVPFVFFAYFRGRS